VTAIALESLAHSALVAHNDHNPMIAMWTFILIELRRIDGRTGAVVVFQESSNGDERDDS
jgi:hypothetical protein